MLEKLEQKNVQHKEQELLLSDLMNIIRKFQSQLNINLQEEFLRLNANKRNSDLLLKLNTTTISTTNQSSQLQQQSNQSAINKAKVKNRLN